MVPRANAKKVNRESGCGKNDMKKRKRVREKKKKLTLAPDANTGNEVKDE